MNEINKVKLSDEAPFGRIDKLYNPEMFQKHDIV